MITSFDRLDEVEDWDSRPLACDVGEMRIEEIVQFVVSGDHRTGQSGHDQKSGHDQSRPSMNEK